MGPKFFFNKVKEVSGFLDIVRGKFTGDQARRLKGVSNALKALKDERKDYEREKKELQGPPGAGSQGEKVVRESGSDRDISAI